MGKYPSYPYYRKSGSQVLGEIPDQWLVGRLKFNVDPRRPITYGIVQCGPDVEMGIPYIRPVDMNDESGISASKLQKTTSEIALSYRRSSLLGGDLVISIGPSFGKVMVVPDELAGANLTQGTARVSLNRKTDRRFIFWVLRSKSSHAFWTMESSGATFTALTLENLAETPVAFPSKAEQEAIGVFLDHETGKIDQLIARQERLIELLKEKRQAVISHAVTKGLNPDAPMKDSGVEWLGEVPAHWVITAIKHLFQAKKGAIKTGPFGSHLKGDDMMGSDIKVINQRNVIDNDFTIGEAFVSHEKHKELKSFEVCPKDLLITTRGTIGRVAIAPDDLEPAILHPCLMRMQFDQSKVMNRFAAVVIADSGYFMEQLIVKSNATTIEVIYSENLENVVIALPPTIDEQDAILEHLESRVVKIETLIDKAKHAVGLLKEHRTALISAAVTGKIDVRGWQKPNTEPQETATAVNA